jgi:hypothetical protein
MHFHRATFNKSSNNNNKKRLLLLFMYSQCADRYLQSIWAWEHHYELRLLCVRELKYINWLFFSRLLAKAATAVKKE